jgi:hypothetical protein
MSGSGSSGFGGGFERSAVSCEDLVLNTQIASPQPAVIRLLKVNDILQVDPRRITQPRRSCSSIKDRSLARSRLRTCSAFANALKGARSTKRR